MVTFNYTSKYIYEILMKYMYNGDAIESTEYMKLIIFNDKGRVARLLTLCERYIIIDEQFLQKLLLIGQASSFLISCNFIGKGKVVPNEQDYRMIQQLKEASIHVPLFDYMIVTKDNFYSFADNKIL